ncbi:hypothetical protein D9758_006854 [Tetrapyrgos nigripes]|uniref:Uncharacterized protein n=1 Tax=Tetrapyrgos nigripes TaxID=182062 RepID=A0A8H5CVC0_9AGAR|nr:hypothetical protein D9758_006854 [Tetrapyrgos nigripes]
MPKRVFSEMLAEELDNGSFLDVIPRSQRRKTGLNSKFDRMIERMNISYHSPTNTNRYRNRSYSTGSSSVSSYGVPQTPVDPYEGLQAGALGEDFALIKMNSRIPGVDHNEGDEDEVVPKKRCISPLPSWLSDTFSTLSKGHPLRLLLPPESQSESTPAHSASSPIPAQELDDTENVFAFHPPSPTKVSKLQAAASVNSPEIPRISQRHVIPSPSPPLPFSTPGPASSIIPPSPPNSHIAMSLASFAPEIAASPAVSQLSRIMSSYSPDVPIPSPVLSLARVSSHSYQDLEVQNLLVPSANQCSPYSAPILLNHHHNFINEQPNPDDAQPDLFNMDSNVSHISDAFSAPGPTYYTSRSVYFDTPIDDPSSDPPDPACYIDDPVALDFQWTPFSRKELYNGQDTKSQLVHCQDVIPHNDTSSLPPSSDAFSEISDPHGRRLISSSASPGFNSGSSTKSRTNDLPIATSSDDYNFEYPIKKKITVPASQQESEHPPSFLDEGFYESSSLQSPPNPPTPPPREVPSSIPETPSPFRFAPPLSSSVLPPPTPTPMSHSLSQDTNLSLSSHHTVVDTRERERVERDPLTDIFVKQERPATGAFQSFVEMETQMDEEEWSREEDAESGSQSITSRSQSSLVSASLSASGHPRAQSHSGSSKLKSAHSSAISGRGVQLTGAPVKKSKFKPSSGRVDQRLREKDLSRSKSRALSALNDLKDEMFGRITNCEKADDDDKQDVVLPTTSQDSIESWSDDE